MGEIYHMRLIKRIGKKHLWGFSYMNEAFRHAGDNRFVDMVIIDTGDVLYLVSDKSQEEICKEYELKAIKEI